MNSEHDTFLSDLKRFGRNTVMRRLEHRDRLRQFRTRQAQLAIYAAFLITTAMTCGPMWILVIAMLPIEAGRQEAWRMRNTGRTYRTWMREPSSPEEIEYVERMLVRRER